MDLKGLCWQLIIGLKKGYWHSLKLFSNHCPDDQLPGNTSPLLMARGSEKTLKPCIPSDI